MIESSLKTNSFFGRTRLSLWLSVAVIFVLGLGIRLYDLTDPPLDFHSTRQLWSAIIARGMFYQHFDGAEEWQRDAAVAAWKDQPAIEPTIFETLVAGTYRLAGREILWVARIYSALFWMAGGVALFLLARAMTSSDGGIAAFLFYAFTSFGAIASRSFQPESLMVLWILLAWWAFYRWHQNPSQNNAVIAGLFAGIAILVKSIAVFMLLGGMAAFILTQYGLKNALKNRQIWLIAILAVLPVGLYMLYGLLALNMQSQFEGRFFPELLTDPTHYVRWVAEMVATIGFSGLVLGLLGVFLFRERPQRAFVLGLWGGYFVYGLFFPYHFLTHNYYHLPLIPVAALSIAPLAANIFRQMLSLNLKWPAQTAVIGILLFAAAYQMWDIRVELARDDYRHEPPYWAAVAEAVGRNAKVVALTQDYGYRIFFYGWLPVENWLESRHLAYRELRGGKTLEFDEWFAEETAGMDYFLVTRIKELDRQPDLKAMLYENYTIKTSGDGYLLFDLNDPLP